MGILRHNCSVFSWCMVVFVTCQVPFTCEKMRDSWIPVPKYSSAHFANTPIAVSKPCIIENGINIHRRQNEGTCINCKSLRLFHIQLLKHLATSIIQFVHLFFFFQLFSWMILMMITLLLWHSYSCINIVRRILQTNSVDSVLGKKKWLFIQLKVQLT